jgi:hypothetical protein
MGFRTIAPMLRKAHFASNVESVSPNDHSDDSTSIGSSRPSSPTLPANDAEGVSLHRPTEDDEAKKANLAVVVGEARVPRIKKEGEMDVDADMQVDAEVKCDSEVEVWLC